MRCIAVLAQIDSLICCFCFPCTRLWKCLRLKPIRQSVAIRLLYVSFLAVITVMGLVMLSSRSRGFIEEELCSRIDKKLCQMIHGPAPVYRMYFILTVWFCALAFLVMGVTNSSSWRAHFHNRFWTIKTIAISCSIGAFMFYPRTLYTGEVWHFFGLNAAFAYVILQFLFLLDIAHTLNFKFVNWVESRGTIMRAKYCYMLLWIPTILLYLVSISSTAYFYRIYGFKSECSNNIFFISFHLYMCISASGISIHPTVQVARPRSGLFQSAVVTTYSTYVLWLTLSNEPDELCSPQREFLYPEDPLCNFQILSGLIFTFFILFTFCLRDITYPQYGNMKQSTQFIHLYNFRDTNWSTSFMPDREAVVSERITNEDNISGALIDDEFEGVEYSYSFFLVTLSLASLYIMMTLTSWYRPEEEENYSVKLIAGWGAIWIKLCSGIFCVFTYIWTLIAPVIFPHSYKDLVFYDILFRT